MAIKSDAQNGRPVKREDIILPATQMEGVCLDVKSSHQSLRNPVPHGEWGDPQEVLKSLLFQRRVVLRMGPRSKQCSEEGGPGTPATEPLIPLDLKSEATH